MNYREGTTFECTACTSRSDYPGPYTHCRQLAIGDGWTFTWRAKHCPRCPTLHQIGGWDRPLPNCRCAITTGRFRCGAPQKRPDTFPIWWCADCAKGFPRTPAQPVQSCPDCLRSTKPWTMSMEPAS